MVGGYWLVVEFRKLYRRDICCETYFSGGS